MNKIGILPGKNLEQVGNSNFQEGILYIARFKNSIWVVGIHSWLFGFTDRFVAAIADSYLSVLEIVHLLIVSFFFISWLYLNPEKNLAGEEVKQLQSYKPNSNLSQNALELCVNAQERMLELQEQHLISQEYLLPFPYWCQVYHLLNLKHLETVHQFSLGNLKIIQVSYSKPTPVGGKIKFQTCLISRINALRIWRQQIVEAELTLHSPYTVELKVPVYNSKHIIVIFNVFPLSPTEHKFFIDIYSNLEWPKPLLQILLHFAASLTLFEDLPYYSQLAKSNVSRLFNSGKGSKQDMWLMKRFVELYGETIKPLPEKEPIFSMRMTGLI